MEAYLDKILKGKEALEIEELLLDGCHPIDFKLLAPFKNLKFLSLNLNFIKSLDGFPELPKLEKLELSDNQISGGFEALTSCQNLESVTLCKNKVESTDCLKCLSSMKKLSKLDLLECPVTEMEGYRDKMFEMISTLKFLDGIDDEGNEDEEEDEEGSASDDYEESGYEVLIKDDLEEEDEDDEDYVVTDSKLSDDDDVEISSDGSVLDDSGDIEIAKQKIEGEAASAESAESKSDENQKTSDSDMPLKRTSEEELLLSPTKKAKA